jgi:ATP-dependent RNA helicase DDX49/DBP8
MARTESVLASRSPSYASSNVSDEEISEHQDGSRKRRKLAPPVATASRIKAKTTTPHSSLTKESSAADTSLNNEGPSGFASLGVTPWLSASLASMEIKKPTGIQSACIPEILKGRDCIGGSRTGTGKTVAFTVPILQTWAEDPCGIYALMLT